MLHICAFPQPRASAVCLSPDVNVDARRFNNAKFSLVPGSPAGEALDATAPKNGTDGVTLT